jgi:hypothetical protein
MPLSENEQRLLDEMERNLYKNEADVMSTMGLRRAPNYTAIGIGVLVGLAGIITMVVGVYLDVTVLGIAGFGVLFAGAMVAATMPSPSSTTASPAASKASAGASASSASFMDRLNERWDRREGGGRL